MSSKTAMFWLSVTRNFVIALTAATLIAAQNRVSIWKSGELKADAQKLAGRGGIVGNPLGSYGNHSTAIWHRESSGQAELHKVKTDVIVVQTGEATLVYGGSIPNSKITASGEVRGSSITGGERQRIGPGDVIHIEPNTPHQFILDKGKEITYFVVKIASK